MKEEGRRGRLIISEPMNHSIRPRSRRPRGARDVRDRCRARPRRSTHWQKMVILGFDGMDPDLAERWMKEGKLPNMRRIAEQGGLYPLTTTHSAESPTAWASFATGVNPGKHNIYDFLVRDTATYLPDLGMVRREPAEIPLQLPPDRQAQHRVDSRRDVVLGHCRTCGRSIEHPDRPGDVSSGRGPQRRAARGTAAAGYSRHDGHVLLFRDRLEPLRRGQHRDSAASSAA